MRNAHLRIGSVEYSVSTKKIATRVKAFCDRFAMDESQAHMLSVFGNDTEIAAISAGLSIGASLTVTLPNGSKHYLSMGDKVTTYRGHIQLPGRPRPVRRLLAFSKPIMENGQNGSVYLLERDPMLIWATTISLLGLPATPAWSVQGVQWLTESGKVEEMSGFNCSPVKVTIGREELLQWIGDGVRKKKLPFPEKLGPIIWPRYGLKHLAPRPEADIAEAA